MKKLTLILLIITLIVAIASLGIGIYLLTERSETLDQYINVGKIESCQISFDAYPGEVQEVVLDSEELNEIRDAICLTIVKPASKDLFVGTPVNIKMKMYDSELAITLYGNNRLELSGKIYECNGCLARVAARLLSAK